MGPKPSGRAAGPGPGTGPGSAASASARHKGAPRAPNSRGDAMSQKRAKLHAARNVPAQPAHAALKDGELDLQAFIAAHEFEIKSLEQSMATSKAVSTSRAFQKVPRGLRRRTASHNPKRVPRRLRARARKEMADDNTPVVEPRRRKPTTTRARIRAETAKRIGLLAARKRKERLQTAAAAQEQEGGVPPKKGGVVGRKPRPKIRRDQLNEPPRPDAKFRRRQINKTWLPTHPWHAKRARMTEPKRPLWRFAIPLTPNDKIYRPTHRSHGERGTMLWDTSYMSTIGLLGNPAGMERVLRSIGITQESCWNERGRRWRLGARSWCGMLSRAQGQGRRLICPAAVLWNPESLQPAETRGCGEEQQPQPAKKQPPRQVYLRIHPSAFLELFNELLRLAKMETPRLHIEDLRFEIGSVELTGPASTEALLAVLTPYATKETPKSAHGALFESLKGLTNPATLPANALLGFSIQDPRLRYPPRKVEFPDCAQAQMDLLERLASWPADAALEPFALLDRNIRHTASSLPSQKSINRRRGSAAPGSFPRPTEADPPIPVLLMATRSASSLHAQGTWTLLAPWKCITPIWYGLVHVPLVSGLNPRFGGMNETMQVAFERGLAWFPADYLATDAGAEWELAQRKKRREQWQKRPKSKRTEWAALDLGAGRRGEVGDGLSCDFEFLFGLPKTGGDDNKPPEREDAAGGAMDIDKAEESSPAPGDTSPPSLKLLNSVSKAAFDALVASSAVSTPTHPNSILNVRISLIARGAVSACARVYRLPCATPAGPSSETAQAPALRPPADGSVTRLARDLRSRWMALADGSAASKPPKASKPASAEARMRMLAQELLMPPPRYPPGPPNQDSVGGHPPVPDAADLIGFVTAGSYCLAEGRGAAMASIALDRVLADVRASRREGRLCIVRNAGENVGRVARWDPV